MKEKSFKVISGKEKVILSAPHCVIHKRGESIRPGETKTGIIVKGLSKKCNTYGIYKDKNENNDANWDEECEYKKHIEYMVKKEKIKALIDFHGMAAYREQDICIGINDGKNIYNNYNIVEMMINIFYKYGFENVAIDKPFNAAYKYCVSNFISSNCKIPTFQIEINLKYRSARYKEYEKYKDLMKALKEITELVIHNIDI